MTKEPPRIWCHKVTVEIYDSLPDMLESQQNAVRAAEMALEEVLVLGEVTVKSEQMYKA